MDPLHEKDALVNYPAGQSSDTLIESNNETRHVFARDKYTEDATSPVIEICETERKPRLQISEQISGWWWEISSIAVSIISFGLIIVVLFVTNGKPLSSWRLPIQPNSLVAVFSTVSKAALLVPVAGCISELKWKYFSQPRNLSHFQAFDDASRGPWGALTFLFKVDAGGSWLGWVGAMATILALAFEPLTQQSIQMESREVLLRNVTGHVSQARKWSNINGTAWKLPNKFDQIRTSTILYMLDLELYVAVAENLGFLNGTGLRPTLATPGFNCPAPICRVPEYMTIAACSKCERVQTVGYENMNYRFSIAGKLPSKADSFTQVSRESALKVFDKYPYLSWMNVSGSASSKGRPDWPDARSHWNGTDICDTRDIVEGHQMVAGPLGHNRYYNDYNLTQRPVYNMIMSTSFRSHFGGRPSSGIEFDPCTTRRVEWDLCSIDLCVETHAPTVIKNGVQKPSNIERTLFTRIFNDTANADLLTGVVVDTNRIEHSFQIHREGFAQLIDSINDMNWDLADAQRTGRPLDPDWITFHSAIANYLTGRIQSQRNPDITLMSIDAFETDVFVNVNWPWLIVPMVVLIISALLLIFTTHGGSQQGFLFKASILAVLFHGWQGEIRDDADGKEKGKWETEETLLRKGNNVRAVLKRDAFGDLKLVKED